MGNFAMSERFIKFIPSEEAFWLMDNKPNAFRLLSRIANTARRSNGNPDGLNIGQCHLQHWTKYNLTEREYRTAKDILVKRKHIKIIETNRTRQKSTTGSTTGSTLVQLISSTIYDINQETNDDRIDDRATTDRRQTRIYKKEKEIHIRNREIDSRATALLADFCSSLLKNLPSFDQDRLPKGQTQLQALSKLLTKHGEEKVRQVFTYAHESSFWIAHVHTPIYLKNKFDTLLSQMSRNEKPNTNKKEENKSYAEKIALVYSAEYCIIEVLTQHVEFVPIRCQNPNVTVIKYDDNGFKEQIDNNLRKHNFKKKV